MSATVKCNTCGRIAFARVIADEPDTNYFECEPEWNDEDVEYGYIIIDGVSYVYEQDDVECRLFLTLCQHEDFDVLEVEYDDGPD